MAAPPVLVLAIRAFVVLRMGHSLPAVPKFVLIMAVLLVLFILLAVFKDRLVK